MNYIIHRGGEKRLVLQNTETGGLVGLMLLPFPGESANAFAYDFGSVIGKEKVSNWSDFPQLAEINFFAIEYPSYYNFDTYFCNQEWLTLQNFLRAEAKFVAYNLNRDKKVSNPFPNLWEYTPPNPAGVWKVPAWGLWVNDDGCWVGNRDGWVFALSHEGEVLNQHKLPKMVRSLFGNEHTIFASCDDGQIYDLTTGKLPQSVYNARPSNRYYDYEFPLLALHYSSPYLLLADLYGQVTLLTSEFQIQWEEKYDLWRIWFLEFAEQYIYLGHSRGVNCYHLETGKILWEKHTTSAVLTGKINGQSIIVGCSDGGIYCLNQIGNVKNKQTEMIQLATCEGAVYACTISEDGQYIWASDYQGSLYCFTMKGELLSTKELGVGAFLALKIWGNNLYGVTTNGTIIAMNHELFLH